MDFSRKIRNFLNLLEFVEETSLKLNFPCLSQGSLKISENKESTRKLH
jgi:hypothetical protein